MSDSKKMITLIFRLIVIAIIALCITFFIYSNNRNIINSNNKIAILDGVVLKSKAKCFELHKQIDEQLAKIFQNIRKSELKFKNEYNSIRNNKKWSTKQRQREITKLENKLHTVSQKYNEEVQNIKKLEFKLGNYIQNKLDEIIKEIAKQESYTVVLNKETTDTIIVFYNISNIDITARVIQLLDLKLAKLNIENIPDI